MKKLKQNTKTTTNNTINKLQVTTPKKHEPTKEEEIEPFKSSTLVGIEGLWKEQFTLNLWLQKAMVDMPRYHSFLVMIFLKINLLAVQFLTWEVFIVLALTNEHLVSRIYKHLSIGLIYDLGKWHFSQ